MKLRTLGKTGIKVSPYCLGTMMFGPAGNADHEDSERIIARALDSGINFVDTADVYGGTETEVIVGKALQSRRDDVVLATKFSGPIGADPNHAGMSRRWIVTAVENSLRRLNTDYIDLYQIHHLDPSTDLEETLAALTDLVASGKVRAIGSSSFPASTIVEAQWIAEKRGLARLRTEQPTYSMLSRGIERDVLPRCGEFGMGVLTWSPLSFGLLTGKYRSGGPEQVTAARKYWAPRHMTDPAKFSAVEDLAGVADRAGVTLTHLAMAFVTAHPQVTSAIIGPRTMEQLDDLLAGADLILEDAVMDEIDLVVAPGTDIGVTDLGYRPPAITDAYFRRRRLSERAAS